MHQFPVAAVIRVPAENALGLGQGQVVTFCDHTQIHRLLLKRLLMKQKMCVIPTTWWTNCGQHSIFRFRQRKECLIIIVKEAPIGVIPEALYRAALNESSEDLATSQMDSSVPHVFDESTFLHRAPVRTQHRDTPYDVLISILLYSIR